MSRKSEYKKSGYFDFEIFERGKKDSKETNIESLEDQENAIKNFSIPTDKYKKTMMKQRKIKYEIKD